MDEQTYREITALLDFRQHSGATRAAYARHMAQFNDWLEESGAAFDETGVGEYLATLSKENGEPYNGSTLNQILAALKLFAAAAYQLHRRDSEQGIPLEMLHEIERIDSFQVAGYIPAALELAELAALADAFKPMVSLTDAAYTAVINVGLLGLRSSSVRALTWGQFQAGPEGYVLRRVWQKGDRYIAAIPLPPEIAEALLHWEARLNAVDDGGPGEHVAPDRPMFPAQQSGERLWRSLPNAPRAYHLAGHTKATSDTTLNNIVAEAAARCGIVLNNGERMHFHVLRHSVVRAMRRWGAPDEAIMAVSGHESRQAFHRYASLLTLDVFSNSALAVLPPRSQWSSAKPGQTLRTFYVPQHNILVQAFSLDEARRQVEDLLAAYGVPGREYGLVEPLRGAGAVFLKEVNRPDIEQAMQQCG